MLNKIKDALDKRAEKVSFMEENHTYWVGADQYTSVSETLAFYNSNMDDIPNMAFYADRGTRVHKALEEIALGNKPIVQKEDEEFVMEGFTYLYNHKLDGWEVLSAEQIMYDIPEKVAGTVDLLLYKEGKIKIVDWKTGVLKMSHYAQIGLYEFLLRKSLGSRLMKDIEITTELVSLKG